MKKLIECESDAVVLKAYTGNVTDLDSFIETLTKIRSTVPGCAETKSWIDGYDDDEIHICFKFKREETDEEYQARQKKEYWEKKRIADDEKEMYRKLKAKFEGDTK